MSENQEQKDSRHQKKHLSLEEKRNYCVTLEKSGMSKVAFCKANGISKSALYHWRKTFKQDPKDFGFSPLVLEKEPPAKQADIIELTMGLSHQLQLRIAMPAHRLVQFIQELGYATAIIR